MLKSDFFLFNRHSLETHLEFHLSFAMVYGQAKVHYNLVQNEPPSKKFTEKEGNRGGCERRWVPGGLGLVCTARRPAVPGGAGTDWGLSQALHMETTL